MTHNIKKLEKENAQFKQKWENSNYSALALASQKAKADEDIIQQKIKIEKLESLCRALQNERSNLKKAFEETKKLEEIKNLRNINDKLGEYIQQSEENTEKEKEIKKRPKKNNKESQETNSNLVEETVENSEENNQEMRETIENIEEKIDVSKTFNNKIEGGIKERTDVNEKSDLSNIDDQCCEVDGLVEVSREQ